MSYETLFANQVEDLLADEKTLVFDHRDTRSYASAHLPGAIPASDENLGRLIKSRAYDRPILVYCYHGNSSRDLCKFIMQFGFRTVYNLEGGWQAWSAHANRLQTDISNELHHWLGMNGFDASNLNSRIENGMSSLMIAILQGSKTLVSELLEAGVDPNLLNDDDNNALWFACVNGEPEIIRLVIDYGVDIDNQNVNGATALIYAASTGKIEAVKLLTENQANLHKKTLDDFTALESAASLPVLKYLKQWLQSGNEQRNNKQLLERV